MMHVLKANGSHLSSLSPDVFLREAPLQQVSQLSSLTFACIARVFCYIFHHGSSATIRTLHIWEAPAEVVNR